MIDHLHLRQPIFRKSATYGHFGREDIDFTWERVDAIDELRAKAA
jgi:S-adenosylmethionine synthetase